MSHFLDSLFKLPAPFRGKPRIATLISAITTQADELENLLSAIDTQRDVETADRRHLEKLANLVGETRRPVDTEILRNLVKGRGFVNSSDGTLGTLIDLHRRLFGSVAAEFSLFPPKYLQIRQPISTLPTSTSMGSIEIVRLYIALLEACSDPALMVEIVFYAPEQSEFPGDVSGHEHSLGLAVRSS